MPADAIVDSELKSLRDQLSAADRKSAAEAQAAPPPAAAAEERGLQDLLAELADEAAHFFKEAEKDIAAHPAASAGTALLVGIVVGLLLARR